MNLKDKTIAILLISIFLLSTLSAVSAADVDYRLKSGKVNLDVDSNGQLHVSESIKYHFYSLANGVYRDIPLKDNQTIENLKVSVNGAYGEYKIYKEDGKYRIKVYLYTDATKKHKIRAGTDVILYYDYDFNNVIKIYKDTGELHYKLWGSEWDVGVSNFKSTIRFPDKKGIEYWVNPYNQISSEKWDENTLEVKSDHVSSGDYIELRVAIPLSEFDNPTYAQFINSNGLENIKNIQKDYETQNAIANFGFLGYQILAILSLGIPIWIYIKYGREPKINYKGIYEREPPTKDNPVFVNAMKSSFSSDVGTIDDNGFQAAIMDLINRKFISISREETGKNNAIMIINHEKVSELTANERMIINILKNFEKDGGINLNDMKHDLKNQHTAEKFIKDLSNWKDDFKRTYISRDIFKKYFIEDGSTYMKIYSIAEIIISGIIIYFSLESIVTNAFRSMIIAILMIIISIIILALPSTIGGRWTKYGAEYNAKWKNFRKYLKDYSLIKEHPPESIAIWNEYLVYATALGVADEVYKAMNMEVHEGMIDSDIYWFCYIGGFHSLDHAISTGISTASSSNNGVGGIGGGSGGGGGGAF